MTSLILSGLIFINLTLGAYWESSFLDSDLGSDYEESEEESEESEYEGSDLSELYLSEAILNTDPDMFWSRSLKVESTCVGWGHGSGK